jgi:putative glutamine amidotransferase
MKKRLIGVTGPSSFTEDVLRMVETFFKANFVLLYHDDADNLEYWTKRLSGVILGGGTDIHPMTYSRNITTHDNFAKFDIRRDVRELFVVKECMNNNVPLLGICRGHQLLGVYHGVELFADITHGRVAHTPHRHEIVLKNYEPAHRVKLFGKTKELFNKDVPEERRAFVRENNPHSDEIIWVNSYHHQALKYYGKGNDRKWKEEDLYVHGVAETGIKECGEIIELMSGASKPWLSCQWHPELDYESNTPSRKVLERFDAHMVRYEEQRQKVNTKK